MVLKVADRIKQLTTSTGTGDISFSATPTGFSPFSSALTNGDTTYYCIEENDKWEVGVGTYGSDNMVRSYILASSNNGNAINLGGSGTVFITYPAGRSTYQDEQSRVVIGASGIILSNGTVIKEGKITELTDVDSSGTISSTNLLSFDSTQKAFLLEMERGRLMITTLSLGMVQPAAQPVVITLLLERILSLREMVVYKMSA